MKGSSRSPDYFQRAAGWWEAVIIRIELVSEFP